MPKTEVVWTGLRAPSCKRRSCFWTKTEKMHEFCTDGSTPTGPLGKVRMDAPPVVFRREFKTCGQRWTRTGCPEKWRR